MDLLQMSATKKETRAAAVTGADVCLHTLFDPAEELFLKEVLQVVVVGMWLSGDN